MKKLDHIPQLDGLRACAILMVLIIHYFKNATWPIQAEYFPSLYIYTSWFWAGVDLFFVLSGFLIGRILINAKGSENYFKSFYTRRAFRIFPAYYFILIAFMFFDALTTSTPFLTGQHPPLWSFFVYLQNFFFDIKGNNESQWLSTTWSLAIEEQFYLILPLLIYLLPKRFIPYICVAGIVIAPMMRAFYHNANAYVALVSRMDALLVGVLIAYYHLKEKTRFNQWYFVPVLLIGLATIRHLIIYSDFEKFALTYNHSILALFFGCLLLFAINSRGIFEKVFTLAPLVFIGKISYMMYLTHQIFNGIYHYYFLGHKQPTIANWTDAGVTVAALASCMIFCHFSYKYFESPLIKLGHKYHYK